MVTCAPGDYVNKTVSENGCGAEGQKIFNDWILEPILGAVQSEGFTPCCNIHDKGYGTCEARKDDVDNAFRTCNHRVCDDDVAQRIEGAIKQMKAVYSSPIFGSMAFVTGAGWLTRAAATALAGASALPVLHTKLAVQMCHSSADLVFKAVDLAGCDPYKAGQLQGCECR